MLYLFDIDGTLIRSGGAGLRALERAFARRYGIEGGMQGIHPGGKTDPLIVAEMFAAHLGRAPDPGERDTFLDEYCAVLREELRAADCRVLPGVHDLLERLAVLGEPAGLCTGNTLAGARLKLERVGLWDRFGFGGFGSDHAERAAIVRMAIARGSAAAGREFAGDEVLVVGDTPLDIAAARSVGARVAAVATGPHSRAALARHAPDLLLDTLEELAASLPQP